MVTESVDKTLDQYLRHLEKGEPAPSLDGLTPRERRDVEVGMRMIRSIVGSPITKREA